ncbi:carbonic anhydrase [Salinimicrobium marinum]|nr:carbonic anhydrase [Salinimicrobium marinum]
MTNRKMQLILCFGVFLMFLQTSCAQTRNTSERDQSTMNEENLQSREWREENYIVNRDSASANPYYGLQKLRGGNQRFEQGRSIHPRQHPELVEALVEGQYPFATIVGCSDSRVATEIIFDQGFGDLFVARTAGQVMTQASYATLEYAYLNLGTKLIVVLGHSSCGAVTAAVERPADPPSHIVSLINAIKPAALAVEGMGDNQLEMAVKQNVINQVEELRRLEAVLSRGYEKGDLLIVGAVYDLPTGNIEFLEETLQELPATNYSTKDITGL